MTNLAALGTSAATKAFLVLSALPNPTVSELLAMLEQQARPILKTTSMSPIVFQDFIVSTIAVNDGSFDVLTRPTTQKEELIGEIRSWNLLSADWDGEGAVMPSKRSMKEASQFVALLNESAGLPEPMLLGSGHAALYWNDAGLYADLEFLGDGRVAYFIRRNGDKHKGVVAFDSQQVPTVFSALIGA